MLFNIWIMFIIPWIFGIFLFIKDKRLILIIVPIASALSFTFDRIGSYFTFWRVYPTVGNLSSLPSHLGLYPVISCYLIYVIKTKKINHYVIIFCFALFTTLLEQSLVFIGRVSYHNGWTMYWTFVSYFIPYVITYKYYNYIESLDRKIRKL